MNRRSFIGLIFALPLVRHLKPKPKLLRDVEWCNDPSFIGHRVTSRTALPQVRYARFLITTKTNPQFSGIPVRCSEKMTITEETIK